MAGAGTLGKGAAGATAGSGTGGSGEAGSAVTECGNADFRDSACPDAPPSLDAACIAGAICDYRCPNGCISHELFCAQPGEPWRSAVFGCELGCSEQARDWSGSLTLRFALDSGSCGSIGDLTYNIDTGQLEVYSCVVLEGTVDACSVVQRLSCVNDGAVVEIDLSLQRFRSVWAGTAFVNAVGVYEDPCSGTYNVASS